MLRATVLTCVLAAAVTAIAESPTPDGRPPQEAPRVAVGDRAPDLVLDGSDGKVHRLSDAVGKQPLVLVFFRGTW